MQVKRHAEAVSADGLRSFMALLGDQDIGIFVCTGGFTSAADHTFNHDRGASESPKPRPDASDRRSAASNPSAFKGYSNHVADVPVGHSFRSFPLIEAGSLGFSVLRPISPLS